MAGFEMCERCRTEYDDPADRRFHAQPNACPDCGPAVRLTDSAGRLVPLDGARDPIEAAARALAAGAVIAVKGLGGFHLACRVDSEPVVAALRGRKHREDKPFAIMVADVESAKVLTHVGAEEAELLQTRARPIVLGLRWETTSVAPSVAPRSRELGVMLPYSPLHHLLLNDVGGPLVMTSGNRSDEPIAYDNDDALERLAGIADLFLLHNRPIQTRTDDSVSRIVAIGPRRTSIQLRRSRGYVPSSMNLPVEARPLLACGAELKNTFCVAKGRRAWVGHHVGDLKNYQTLQSFRAGIEHFERLFSVEVELVAHDLHPDYLSTAYAEERPGVELVAVQHHHAHLAACLAEHGEPGPAIGAIYDGSGYGLDGSVWGGELLYGGLAGFERVGHLWPVRMPGGDQAIREPWRMACAWLVEASGIEQPALPSALRGRIDQRRWDAVARMACRGLAAPVTTSVGRLFDAVAALCGVAVSVNYEGQAAIELEALASTDETGCYQLPLTGAESLLLDARDLVLAVAHEIAAGVPPAAVAARFHNSLTGATAAACQRLAEERYCGTVVLSGGAFQNRRLLEGTARVLIEEGVRVLIPERLPSNDGGIAYGQAAVAASSARITSAPEAIAN